MDNFDELVTTCLVERAAINDKQLEVLKEKIDKTLKERRNEQHVKL